MHDLRQFYPKGESWLTKKWRKGKKRGKKREKENEPSNKAGFCRQAEQGTDLTKLLPVASMNDGKGATFFHL